MLTGSWREWEPRRNPTSLTIGVLDGVHLGHRALIARLAGPGVPAVLTFDPHPVEVLRPGTPPRLLTSLEEREKLFESLGVTVTGVLDLREIRELAPATFVEELLVGKMGVASVTVGVDFRFGRNREGDVALLREMSTGLGFEVDPIELVLGGGEQVSSSRIRGLIEAGAIEEANDLLGSRFAITNAVVGGDERGRAIGFPTANLRPPNRKVIPGTGVYAAVAEVAGTAHMAAVNVGVRPTFGAGELLIEAYLLDFDDDLYGQDLTVRFVSRLRPELVFESVDELVERMHVDVAETRQLLDGVQPFVG